MNKHCQRLLPASFTPISFNIIIEVFVGLWPPSQNYISQPLVQWGTATWLGMASGMQAEMRFAILKSCT